jgi:putative redox protein
MEATVTWQGRMTFQGSAGTGFTLPLGAHPNVGGDNDGFRPLELFAVGLAGCTAMDVISILQKKRQDITGFEVQVSAEQAQEHPRVFTKMHVTYIFTGRNLDTRAIERAIELSETKYCPAQGMLAQIAPMEHTYKVIEAE